MRSERDLIQRYFVWPRLRADVIKGIGDDGAVIRPGAGDDLVISVDTLVEGVHFPSGTPPADVGYKALAVNLSDLAAMGAEPRWATLSLTLPTADENWLAGFSGVMMRLAETYNVLLIGGDLTRGPLSVTLQVIGCLPRGTAMYRSGAQPGDLIFVTGTIGDAGLGLAAVLGARKVDTRSRDYLVGRLHRPSPRIEAGLALRGCASAAIDISDGLAVDLERLLAASQVGATVDVTCVPLSAAANGVFAQETDWPLVLTCGDDYELLFTVPAERAPEVRQRCAALTCGVTEIGLIEHTAGLRYKLGGEVYTLSRRSGYDHFAPP